MATDTITIRQDSTTRIALQTLTRDGTSVTAAVRGALVEAARRKELEDVRAEAEAVAADPEDRAEMARVLADLETLRAW